MTKYFSSRSAEGGQKYSAKMAEYFREGGIGDARLNVGIVNAEVGTWGAEFSEPTRFQVVVGNYLILG